jgi:hypothetical protein
VANLQSENYHKNLFTIKELKEMSKKRRARPMELQKANFTQWQDEYARRIQSHTPPLKFNFEFFGKCYENAKDRICRLVPSCNIKQNQEEEHVELGKPVLINNNLLSDGLKIKRKRNKPTSKDYKPVETKEVHLNDNSYHKQAEKVSKGAHWEQEEKELFYNMFKVYGKNWKALRANFPNKTDKQLRNFYQNNRTKLPENDGQSDEKSPPFPINNSIHQ